MRSKVDRRKGRGKEWKGKIEGKYEEKQAENMDK